MATANKRNISLICHVGWEAVWGVDSLMKAVYEDGMVIKERNNGRKWRMLQTSSEAFVTLSCWYCLMISQYACHAKMLSSWDILAVRFCKVAEDRQFDAR